MIVNILGTQYAIEERTSDDDAHLINCDGYCDESIKLCVTNTFEKPMPNDKHDLQVHKRKVLRHEIIHAFLFESGLAECSWATNEEMVDWIAKQFPKIYKAFKQAECLE